MIEKWYLELENKFKDVQSDYFVVMPNHFHCIISKVGADLCVCPKNKRIEKNSERDINKESIKRVEHTGSPLHSIIQWFKTMTTNEYIRGVKNNNWRPFPSKLWQRNYYERVIRSDRDLYELRKYIKYNPLKWTYDKYY